MGRISLLAAILLAGVVLVGCGGSGNDVTGEEGAGHEGEAADCESLAGEAAREECERAEVAKRIPEADRIGYFQVATTAGLLRATAVAASSGAQRPTNAGGAELRLARERVAATNPHDAGLVRLRRLVLGLLATEQGGLDRGQARRTLIRLRAVDRSLSRYLRRREPAQASLLPD